MQLNVLIVQPVMREVSLVNLILLLILQFWQLAALKASSSMHQIIVVSNVELDAKHVI